MNIQRLQVVLADGANAQGDALRSWADDHSAIFRRILDNSIEFSDYPGSRQARDSAYISALNQIKDDCEKMNLGNNLLIADITGLSEDKINRLQNTIRRTGVPVMSCSLSGAAHNFPRMKVSLSPEIDFRNYEFGLDIIGDIHGCAEELTILLGNLGWFHDGREWNGPQGRRIVFVGDIVDRGPNSIRALEIVMSLCRSGNALCVTGNHDFLLQGWLMGKKSTTAHGMGETHKQLSELSVEARKDILDFLQKLPPQLVLDNGNLIVAHAGCPEKCQGILSESASKECIFGTMLYKDENGLPVRDDWAARYTGSAVVVQGHVPVFEPNTVGQVWDIDTGCAFGGSLSALRYPEMEIESVPALCDYTNGHPTALRIAAEKAAALSEKENHSSWSSI